jgi:hypothetical protein
VQHGVALGVWVYASVSGRRLSCPSTKLVPVLSDMSKDGGPALPSFLTGCETTSSYGRAVIELRWLAGETRIPRLVACMLVHSVPCQSKTWSWEVHSWRKQGLIKFCLYTASKIIWCSARNDGSPRLCGIYGVLLRTQTWRMMATQ